MEEGLFQNPRWWHSHNRHFISWPCTVIMIHDCTGGLTRTIEGVRNGVKMKRMWGRFNINLTGMVEMITDGTSIKSSTSWSKANYNHWHDWPTYLNSYWFGTIATKIITDSHSPRRWIHFSNHQKVRFFSYPLKLLNIPGIDWHRCLWFPDDKS